MAGEVNEERGPEIQGFHDNSDLMRSLDDCATGCLNGCLGARRGQQDHSVWMKLYTASERLKLAVHDQNVPEAIVEIVSNLMACEEMAVLKLQDSHLCFLASSGINEKQKEALIANSGKIAAEIGSGQITVVDPAADSGWWLSEFGVSAFVPVWLDDQPSAAIVLYRFLPHRNGFNDGDRELLQLFSIYSGPCLFDVLRPVQRKPMDES